MEALLSCNSCGNRCHLPPSAQRDYVCPRCGHLLPRPDRAGLRPPGQTRWGLIARLRYLLFLGGLFGLVVLGVPGLGVMEGARTDSTADWRQRRAAPVRLTPAELGNYTFRLRQLQGDLKRDPADYEVLRRLGQLHLRLAACQVEGHDTHLRRARFYLRKAQNAPAITNRDAQRVSNLIDAANSPNPVVEWSGMQGDFGAPPRVDEEVIRIRVGWWEDQVGKNPNSSRLLCFLANSYVQLYQVLKPGGSRRYAQIPWASSVVDPEEARRLAEHDFNRAYQCATTDESRSRVLYGRAQLYRVAEEPVLAQQCLRDLLKVQPNNWFAALEMARLCRELDQHGEAARYETQSARWRTPGWL